MPSLARLIIDPPLSGERNMAIDADLLDRGVNGHSTLRFYQWNEPTISLGHFQAVSSESIPPQFRTLPVVKRLSGGGAILHDQELTYSCVVPKDHPIARTPSRLYDLIHQEIIIVLSEFGVHSQLRGDESFPDKPFLCFSRGDQRDIIIGNHKIVGSAQRRRQGAILQHGSILLKLSRWTPEFPGIEDITGIQLDPSSIVSTLAQRIANALDWSLDEIERPPT